MDERTSGIRKIAVITGSRAEYGLLYWLIRALQEAPDFELQLVVSGMHLMQDFGSTVDQIEKDGFPIAARVDLELSTDDDLGVARSTGLGVQRFAATYEALGPDLVIVLGDRFEILSATVAALIGRIPVAHLHGGELSEGAFDDAIRHSITKMSHLHFVAAEEYARRVKQLGEDPDRVYNVGAIGLENIARMRLLSRADFEDQTGVRLAAGGSEAPNLIVTFHPATLSPGAAMGEMKELLGALSQSAFQEATIVFTAPNADNEGRSLIPAILDFVENRGGRTYFFHSMGQIRYLSFLQWADAMVGNSSSGLIEAPAFHLPTVNIGDRQTGRLKAASVVDCLPAQDSIVQAIQKALSSDFRKSLRDLQNPYGAGDVSGKIMNVLRGCDFSTLLKKRFHDLPAHRA